MKLALIPCGATEWHEQGRLLGRVELSLSAEGRRAVLSWAEELRPQGLSLILHAGDELSVETARTMREVLRVNTKVVEELAEVDVGLWAGLTSEELETRYESAYKGLCDAPLSIHPPGGEAFADALARLKSCLRRQLRASRVKPVGLILRPLAWALVHCYLEGGSSCDVFPLARRAARPVLFEIANLLPKDDGAPRPRAGG